MRSFTLSSVSRGNTKMRLSGGRYISETPSGAARKAFSKIIQTRDIKGKVTLKISVTETTQNSAKKTWTYKVSKIPETTTVIRDGQEITYSFTTKLYSVS